MLLTVYDPNDVARTTIKETTVDNDWIGMAAPAEAQPKLTVYDPNDVARTTIRETTEDSDYLGVIAPADVAQTADPAAVSVQPAQGTEAVKPDVALPEAAPCAPCQWSAS